MPRFRGFYAINLVGILVRNRLYFPFSQVADCLREKRIPSITS